YSITPNNGGCVGDPYNVVLTVNPQPVVSTSLNAGVCSDTAAGITLNTNGTSVSAASYTINSITPSVVYSATWIANGGNSATGGGQSATAIVNDVYTNHDAVSHTVTYNVTPISSAGCTGAAQDVVLTVNPEPVLSASLNATVCSDSPGNITLNTNGTS